MRSITHFLGEYVFYYPLITSLIWVLGGMTYYFRMRRGDQADELVSEREPYVSILVPARNEGPQIEETIRKILDSNYTNFEIIIINDASWDNTKEIVENLMKEDKRIRLLNLKENMGKASAMNYALLVSKGEIIVTIDADCSPEKDCLSMMVGHFVKYPRVGAVTGNPRIKNQENLLTQVQASEYSSIIGLIKRSQRMLGKIFTVSGVIAAFRKRALLDAGLWSNNMLTEDIDITWKLEAKCWDVRFEENAICWIITPKTLKGLLKQRLRWCGGGAQVIKKHANIWKNPEMRRMWPIYIDYILSVTWAYVFIICLCYWTAQALFNIGSDAAVLGNPIPAWRGAVIGAVCLVQLLTGIILDKNLKKDALRTCFYAIWFPVVYWFLYSISVVVATPIGLFKKFDKPVKWVSPEREAPAIIKVFGTAGKR